MLTTPRRGTTYPNTDRSDRPDVAVHLSYIALSDDVAVLYQQGTNAARLAAAHQGGGGKFWYETDTGQVFYDDGSAWHGPLGQPALNSITTAMLQDGSVTSAKILDGTIQTVDLADGSVTSAKILDGTIQTVDIADGAVTGAKIADGTITAADLAPGAITVANIAPGVGTGFSSAFPTVGLFNGYRTMLFIPNLDPTDTTPVGLEFVYRADLDAAHPWFCLSRQNVAHYSLGTVQTTNGTIQAFTPFALPNHPGIWDFQFFATVIGSQSGAVGSSVSVSGSGGLGGLASIGSVNSAVPAGGYTFWPPAPVRKTIAGGETISGSFSHNSGYGEAGYCGSQWFVATPIRLAS